MVRAHLHKQIYIAGRACFAAAQNGGERLSYRARRVADRDTERLFRRESVRRWSPALQRAALRKLVIVDAAETLDDLRVPPGNHLEKLSGQRAGQYSIRVNDQWRVCFRWRNHDAFDVALVDYH